MNKKYSIIGGGLSGLTAACALIDCGIDNFAIFDIRTPEDIIKDKIRGLMYLHENPMLLDIPKQTLNNYVYSDVEIKTNKIEEIYLKKIGLYGFIEKTSISYIKKTSDFFDIKKYKNLLIERTKNKYYVLDKKIDENTLRIIAKNSIKTFYTIPVIDIFKDNLECKSLMIFGKESLPANFISKNIPVNSNYVIYNLSDKQSWYRSSFINGRAWLESTDPNFGEPIGYKIIDNPKVVDFWKNKNSEMNIVPVGRYALWSRGILLHHIYNSVKLSLYRGEIIK